MQVDDNSLSFSKQGIEQDEESDSIEQYKPKNKRRKVEIDETVDPEASFDQKITAQMMQHILQLEKVTNKNTQIMFDIQSRSLAI